MPTFFLQFCANLNNICTILGQLATHKTYTYHFTLELVLMIRPLAGKYSHLPVAKVWICHYLQFFRGQNLCHDEHGGAGLCPFWPCENSL